MNDYLDFMVRRGYLTEAQVAPLRPVVGSTAEGQTP